MLRTSTTQPAGRVPRSSAAAFGAVRATLALKAGVWFPRILLVAVAPDTQA